MSEKLAISATLSVLMMSAFVLFAPEVSQVPLGQDNQVPVVNISVPSLPDAGTLLPTLR